jgi:predicted methyltransferase
MIITKKVVDEIRKNRAKGEFLLDVDFGLRQIKVRIENANALLGKGLRLALDQKLKDNFCYLVKRGGVFPLAFFSDSTKRFYKLIPTPDWPSLAIGSVPMHRIKSPYRDTYQKIKLIKPQGIVLDTCAGLGYTAILAASQCRKVFTFEVDPNVLSLARLNPYSQGLFSQTNIELKTADIVPSIRIFKDEYFDCIIHDPPTFRLAPQLYAIAFYEQIRRVLKKGARLYHYLPLCGIRRGRNFPSQVKGKLKKVGFHIETFYPQRGDLLCRK